MGLTDLIPIHLHFCDSVGKSFASLETGRPEKVNSQTASHLMSNLLSLEQIEHEEDKRG